MRYKDCLEGLSWQNMSIMVLDRIGVVIMNIAIIFAGGVGKRMNTKTKPKQFLELHGKPIIIYTIERFDNHPEIDGIIVVCVEEWIAYLEKLIKKFGINKVVKIVPGGQSGQESIYRGLKTCKEFFDDNSIVLLHDGVRPLIDEKVISDNIKCVEKNGSAITVSPAIETVAMKNSNEEIGTILERKKCLIAKAPQSFKLNEILAAHEKAKKENRLEFIDSASLMQFYGQKLFIVEGTPDNIKITTPTDFYIFRAILDSNENAQIFG